MNPERPARPLRAVFADTFYWIAVFNPKVHVIPQTRQSFLAGLDLYDARPDKGYSLTDCISMNVMKAEGVTDILTHDEHFNQEGFRTLFT